MKAKLHTAVAWTVAAICVVMCIPGPASISRLVLEDPAVSLAAPEVCAIGELVTLDATGSSVGGNLIWKIVPETPNFQVADATKRAFFSSDSPGEFLIIIAGAGRDIAALHTHKISVGLAKPEGGDLEPTPDRNVVNLTDFEKKLQVMFRQVSDYPGKKADTTKVASNFKVFARANIPVEAMVGATLEANSEALGSNLEFWRPFLDSLGEYLDNEANLADTTEAYSAEWQRIGEALDKLAK